MMQLKILLFGITRDIIGGEIYTVPLMAGGQVKDLRAYLVEHYPQLNQLRSMLIAVNNEYAEDNVELSAEDEIALIPPVSGG
ncbi:MAG: MoaD/ThiS family protein [Fulvivirga sp.]